MPFFLKSREKAVSQSQPLMFMIPTPGASFPVPQSSHCFLPMAHTSPPSFFLSRRRGVRLTIASALPETGGVTHFGLCVLAVGVRISDCSSGGGRDRGGCVRRYVSIWRNGLSVCSRKRAQEWKLTVVGRKVCSSSAFNSWRCLPPKPKCRSACQARKRPCVAPPAFEFVSTPGRS